MFKALEEVAEDPSEVKFSKQPHDDHSTQPAVVHEELLVQSDEVIVNPVEENDGSEDKSELTDDEQLHISIPEAQPKILQESRDVSLSQSKEKIAENSLLQPKEEITEGSLLQSKETLPDLPLNSGSVPRPDNQAAKEEKFHSLTSKSGKKSLKKGKTKLRIDKSFKPRRWIRKPMVIKTLSNGGSFVISKWQRSDWRYESNNPVNEDQDAGSSSSDEEEAIAASKLSLDVQNSSTSPVEVQTSSTSSKNATPYEVPVPQGSKHPSDDEIPIPDISSPDQPTANQQIAQFSPVFRTSKPRGRKNITDASKTVPCNKCTKFFATRAALKKHSRVHSPKAHVCTIDGCGKSFPERWNLKRHMLVHSKKKPFPCTFSGCGKAFSLDFNFKKHMRVHTGEKPYSCEYDDCDKSFSDLSNLNTHIRRLHKKKSEGSSA